MRQPTLSPRRKTIPDVDDDESPAPTAAPPPRQDAATSVDRTVTAGTVLRRGRRGAYRRLAHGPGEPRLVRHVNGEPSALGPGATSLLRLVHLTDFQLADVTSPGRFEFFEELAGRAGAEAFVPAQRAQEALALHAGEVMARTLRRLGASRETGAPLGLVVCTGDSIDNAQANELVNFTTLLSGGVVVPRSGGTDYEGVQAATWPNPLFWHPDPGTDRFKLDWGFPERPGLLQEAMAPFRAAGVGLPWLSCFGNHDGLALGTAIATPAYCAAVTGASKAVAPPPGPDLLGREEELISHPERFLAGSSRPVTADPERRIVGRTEFVAAHLAAAGLPRGHGFGADNLASETAYTVNDDFAGVRIVVLDTTNLDGQHHGSIGRRQLCWLEEHLTEVHSRFRSPDGRVITTGHADRLVVLASHHGLATLANLRQDPAGAEDDHPRAAAHEVRALLHRFDNVVLWLNGHRHLNEVVFWPSPYDPARGVWEVSTAAMADWPCQARVVEVVVGADGTLSVLSTMVDHGAPPDPDSAVGLEQLAALHRELAANAPGAGLEAGLAGRAEDRNVELTMSMPFAT
jgi:metallophosphoesterase (TIGR03767 family)